MITVTLIKESICLELAYIQRFHVALPWWKAWQCTGRHGAGEVAESSVRLAGNNRERETEPSLNI